MGKDAIYSMRMNNTIREALGMAAKKDRRTVASLLDKVIIDFLQKEGFFLGSELDGERRLFLRKKITLPGTIILQSGLELSTYPSVILNISRGGVLVTYAKGGDMQFTSKGELPHFRVCFSVSQSREELCFNCVARHMLDAGEEIQVGTSFIEPSGEKLQKLASYLM